MPTAADYRKRLSPSPQPPVNSPQPRRSLSAEPKPRVSISPSPNNSSERAFHVNEGGPVPLYQVSETAARQKYEAYLRNRRSISQSQERERSASSEPVISYRGNETIERPCRFSFSNRMLSVQKPSIEPVPVLRKTEEKRPPQKTSPEKREGSNESDKPKNDALKLPIPYSTELAAMTDLVLQLQSALILQRKENMELRHSQTGIVGTYRSQSPDPFDAHREVMNIVNGTALEKYFVQTRPRFTVGTQTAPFKLLDNGTLAFIEDPSEAPRAMDAIDLALEEKRSKRLERLLLDRTMKLSKVEDTIAQAQMEVNDLRQASEIRERELERIKREKDEAVKASSEMSDRFCVVERQRDQCMAAAKKSESLAFQLQKLEATLSVKEQELSEVTMLCEDQHRRITQLEEEKRQREVIDHEIRSRRQVVDWEEGCRQELFSSHLRTRMSIQKTPDWIQARERKEKESNSKAAPTGEAPDTEEDFLSPNMTFSSI